MNKLLSIAGSDGEALLQHHQQHFVEILNQDNPDNYPLGYFHLSEIDTGSYTIE